MDLRNRTAMSEMKQREFSIRTSGGNWVIDCVVGWGQGTVWQVPMVSSFGFHDARDRSGEFPWVSGSHGFKVGNGLISSSSAAADWSRKPVFFAILKKPAIYLKDSAAGRSKRHERNRWNIYRCSAAPLESHFPFGLENVW